MMKTILGTDPTDPNSHLQILSFNGDALEWEARPYELYELLGSTDLMNWSRIANPVLPTGAPAASSGLSGAAPAQFFRVKRLP